MITIHSGHSVDYLTREVAGGREGYYTGAVAAGEPPGQWYGAGAEVLGLSGEVDPAVLESLYTRGRDPRAPDGTARLATQKAYRFRTADELYQEALAKEPAATPERRQEMRREAENCARQSTAFVDLTFSPAKSITVAWTAFERQANAARERGDEAEAAAWAAAAAKVEAAVMAGAKASIDYLQDTTGYARRGKHGGKSGRWEDAHRWVVAQFLQHDSRERDPQLHVHQAVLNLQQTDGGKWYRLDTVAIRQQHHAAGAVGARVTEAELARELGFRYVTRKDGFREIVGVSPAVMNLFSKRTRAITPRVAALVEQYRAQTGREPSQLELAQIAQRATLETRKGKRHDGETAEQRSARWDREIRETFGSSLAEVARRVFAGSPDRAGEPDDWSPETVIAAAVASAGGDRGMWLRADLMRAVNEALPANLGVPADRIRDLLEGLTDAAEKRALRVTPDDVGERELPAERRLQNGETPYRRPGQVYFTTEKHTAWEKYMRAAAVERGAAAVDAAAAQRVVERYAEAGRELGADQRAAVLGVLTSGARVESLVAAAGTGKSFTVGAIAGAWTEHIGRVHGLAPSQVAAEVLRDEGLQAWNTTAWLQAQRGGRGGEGAPPALGPGDLVVLDEAGMASTEDLAAITEMVRAADAKLLRVGDDRQLAAVGPGGAFADSAAHGLQYQLVEVRRFHQEWERAASLQLRVGGVAALDAYDKAGRIVDGGTIDQAIDHAARRWLADTVQGKESLLIVPSNEEAATASARLRAELVKLGRVDDTRTVELGRDGNVAGAGDLLQARQNAWDLKGYQGNERAPVNRETYRVLSVGPDGRSMRVEHTRTGAALQLPAGYVAEHLALAYATTAHGAQGRTVDTGHAVLRPGVDAAFAYVALSRGKESNTAYVETHSAPKDAPTGAALDVERRAPRAVVGDILVREREDRAVLAEAESLAEDARSTATLLERLAVEAAHLTAGRVGHLLDAAAATGAITDEQRIQFATDPATPMLDRVLRQAEVAGHDPAEVLANALRGNLDTAVSPASVVHHRITHSVDLDVRLDTAHALIPAEADERTRPYFEALADAADARRVELGQRVADEAPAWAVRALGPVPEDAVARADWEHRAGLAAQSREAVGRTDDDAEDPLGPAPSSLLLEKYAMWRTAHAALDLPDRGADERELSDGELRVRVVAAERARAWAPAWVGDSLAASAERLADVQASAALLAARADAQPDGAELRAAAAAAEAEAAELTRTVERLQAADAERARWSLHEARTLEEGERARAELGARGVDLDAEPKVTAEQWLAEHDAAMAAEDPHRVVADGDVDEDQPADAGPVLDEADDARPVDEPVVETAVPDVRELASAHPTEYADLDGGTRRVPTADELDDIVDRAAIARLEVAAREQDDAAHADDPVDEDGPSLGAWAAADVDEDVHA